MGNEALQGLVSLLYSLFSVIITDYIHLQGSYLSGFMPPSPQHPFSTPHFPSPYNVPSGDVIPMPPPPPSSFQYGGFVPVAAASTAATSSAAANVAAAAATVAAATAAASAPEMPDTREMTTEQHRVVSSCLF